MVKKDNYRVKLSSSVDPTEHVLIEATPELVETRNVNYKTTDPVHAPGQIVSYVNSSSRTFNISSVKLISRTQGEAEKNLAYLWLLRSWTMPEFGRGGRLSKEQRLARKDLQTKSRNTQYPSDEARRRAIADEVRQGGAKFGTNLNGAPPMVLLLNAYSPSGDRAKRAHIHNVPVVIQNVSIPYPADTDYIPSLSGIPMPTIMTIDMTLMETHSPAEYSNFSLSEFKQGVLKDF